MWRLLLGSSSSSSFLSSSSSFNSFQCFRAATTSTASRLPKKVRYTPDEYRHFFKELLEENERKNNPTSKDFVKPIHWPDIEERLRTRNEEHKIPEYREVWDKIQREHFRLISEDPSKKWDWLYLEKEIFPSQPEEPPQYDQVSYLPEDDEVPEKIPFPREAESLAEPNEITKYDTMVAKLPMLPPIRTPKINPDGTTAAVGRRKTAVVSAIIKPGEGKIVVNHRSFVDYFSDIQWRETVLQPFVLTERIGLFDVYLNAKGGGKGAQAESARMAISRALVLQDPSHRLVLKFEGLLTRDPRMVERKKPGQKKARKKFQWGKR